MHLMAMLNWSCQCKNNSTSPKGSSQLNFHDSYVSIQSYWPCCWWYNAQITSILRMVHYCDKVHVLREAINILWKSSMVHYIFSFFLNFSFKSLIFCSELLLWKFEERNLHC
ncbi:unnamed protein product [Trifolium pratense]|uniref:Uncharacterized protein n=1 Tax=Trifolium pratense TaxID=57577 RepID=A0ACB0J076_TRIPR|nr:unnamed protein product [Trifolium pratense]